MVDGEKRKEMTKAYYISKMNISGAWAWNAAKPAPSPFGI